MISIVLSKSVDKSNTKYYDVVIKWLNIVTLIVKIDKICSLYYNVAIKWLNIVTLAVNIDKIHTLHYDVIIKAHFTTNLSYYLLLYQTIITSNITIITIMTMMSKQYQ